MPHRRAIATTAFAFGRVFDGPARTPRLMGVALVSALVAPPVERRSLPVAIVVSVVVSAVTIGP